MPEAPAAGSILIEVPELDLKYKLPVPFSTKA